MRIPLQRVDQTRIGVKMRDSIAIYSSGGHASPSATRENGDETNSSYDGSNVDASFYNETESPFDKEELFSLT